jgi:secreted Zn-dependent insulinase-like peptidase
MRLTIVSSQSLDQLEQWTTKYFSGIPNVHAPLPTDKYSTDDMDGTSQTDNHKIVEPVRLPNQLGVRYNVVPMSNLRQLQINWYMPTSQYKHYKSKVYEYLSNILGDESQGSIRSILYNDGLINALSAGPDLETTNVDIFTISLDLTAEGLKQINEITTKIYDFLRMLRELGPQKWYWDENVAIADVNLKFQGKAAPGTMASGLSSNMQRYDPEDVVVADYLWSKWDPEAIEAALAEMIPTNMVMVCTCIGVSSMRQHIC